jgi:hypothetical protein
VARPALADSLYADLVAAWPPTELFRYMPDLGHKFSLSKVNHPDRYKDFLASTPVWQRFHDEVCSGPFIPDVLATLRAAGIDLGLERDRSARRLLRDTQRWITGVGVPRLTARFEFSMLPADGGHIKPHTDDPKKCITLVVSMSDDTWDAEWGGGTDILRPIDPRNSYNQLNRQLEFDDVEVVRSYPLCPNQCLVFVKTFNSLHSVSPMRGPDGVMRRTLTINIEQRS